MTPAEARKLWLEAQENQNKLRSCSQHQFPPASQIHGYNGPGSNRITCHHCGGWLDRIGIYRYAQGFKAAGGNPDCVSVGILQ